MFKRYTNLFFFCFFVFHSCQRAVKSVSLKDIARRELCPVDSCDVDSSVVINLYLYKSYLLGVAPQKQFAKQPYVLFKKDSLKHVRMLGSFGHSFQEFMDVNPYFCEMTDSSIIQCTDGNIRTEIELDSSSYRIISKAPLCLRPLNLICQIDDSLIVTNGETDECELVAYDKKSRTFSSLLDYSNDIVPFQDRDALFDYFTKTISYNESTKDLYCFYLNIPLVRIVNMASKEGFSVLLDPKFNPQDNEREYQDDNNRIWCTASKFVNGKIYALYHQQEGDIMTSEIHVWNANRQIEKRLHAKRNIKCFDVDENGGFLYSICIGSDCDKVVKFKITDHE